MMLLVTYVLIALVFSFLCSIAEAVILSVTPVHVALLEQQDKPYAKALRTIKEDINSALAAILTLNTIAHTVGAAGAGAQAALVFGNAYLGVASAILTLLILVFSEIIPKTLGAHYWKQLAPYTTYFLRTLILILYPFVKISMLLTRSLAEGPTLRGMNRQELVAMAEIGEREGTIEIEESSIVRNLIHFKEKSVRDIMTPRTVVFSIPEDMTVDGYFEKHGDQAFSRIPVYRNGNEDVTGFVIRSDLLVAKSRGEGSSQVGDYVRKIDVMIASLDLARAFKQILKLRTHLVLVVDEYGGMAGILSLEDVLETLIGEEIVDESDRDADMQVLARKMWQKRSDRSDFSRDTES